MNVANRRILPGFRLSLSFTFVYLALLVLVPLAACFWKASSLPMEQFRAAVWTERAQAAYLLTFGASLAAALADTCIGLLIAWCWCAMSFHSRNCSIH